MFSADLGGYTPPPVDATNPTFDKVALLLHGDGTNGSQNNTFLDSSTNNFTITRTGNVAQGTFSPFSLPEGQWSNAFGSSGGTTNYLGWSQIDLTSDFTVECWLYQTKNSSSGYVLFMQGTDVNTEFTLNHTTVGSVGLYKNGWIVNPSGTSVTFNAWHHVAWVREGTTCRIYVDGIQQGTGTSNVSIPVNYIGSYTGGGYEMNGYVSNVRIVNGTCLYPNGTTFTPSTTPLTAVTNTALLTCQSNRFKDNSSNNFTITPAGDTKVTAFSPFAPSAAYSASTNGGSAYFDGSWDYLSTSSTTEFAFGTGDWTIECWVYPLATTVGMRIWRFSGDSDNADINITSTGSLNYYNGTVSTTSAGGFILVGQWNHIAMVRSSGTVRGYVNGVQVLTQSTTPNTTTARILYVGGQVNNLLNGYISNVRVVKGSAIYTANFTPPTAPLTAVTNTQLLLNCTNAGIIDNAGKNDIETVGNAQISTAVTKYGTGSMYFDGGSVLDIRNMLAFDTDDWTVECWTNMSNVSNNQLCIDLGFDANLQNGLSLRVNQNITGFNRNSIGAYYNINGSWSGGIFWTYTYPYGEWTHLAYVKKNGVLTVYVNGVSIGNGQSFASNSKSNYSRIGYILAGGASYYNGYIDDLRITKGVALYTSNFTPPTQAFPNQ